jgi:hypothetical protein
MPLLEPHIDLELDEGEEILHLARRHWIVLLQRGLIFMVVGLIATALAIYRARGGTFIVGGVVQEGHLDLINLSLLVLIGGLTILWLRKRNPKQRRLSRDLLYLLAIALLALVFVFRFQGGRLFYIDPFEARNDALNLLLIMVALLMIAALVYVVIDWANDFLILTNFRVVYEDRQLLVRHVQQQMLIADIQQVNKRQESYPEWWLNYGTILIRSFSPRRLIFTNAADPDTMQQRIADEVNKIRRQSEPELLRQMIEDQVYGNRPPKAPGRAIQVVEQRSLLPWLFHPNPEIDYQREVVIWRPFWFFTVLMLLRPVGACLLVTLALVILHQLGLLAGGLAFALWLPVLLVCGFWAFWVHQEYENDRYILTRQNITDVDKRPLGPETRRVAPLGAIQDISYNINFFETVLETLFGLGYGDVVIETGGAGGGNFTFYHVPDPRGVQATINDYLTDFRKRERERQLQDAVALLREYHLAQQAHNELMSWEQVAELIAEHMAQQSQPSVVTPEPIALVPRRMRREVRGVVRNEMRRALGFRRRRRL